MRWPAPLIRGRLLRRYKRYLADVALADGSETTAHCPNPGRMLGLDEPGRTVWLSISPNPLRKLPLTLELIETAGGLVGINTMQPNRLVAEALQAGAIPQLAGYDEIRREVAYDTGCRIDFRLRGADRPDCYVEDKNVHLRRALGAEFPDTVTLRGARHLRALARQVRTGARAVMLYVVQRMDCRDFRLAADLDPAYALASGEAAAAGVESLCLTCHVGIDEIRIAGALPIVRG
jgi:sugar fermentation stimulation protein A